MTPLSVNTPNIPTVCRTTPPSMGPAMRVALPVAESRLIAVDTFPSERSPSRRRRIGMSVAQNKPLRIEASAISSYDNSPR